MHKSAQENEVELWDTSRLSGFLGLSKKSIYNRITAGASMPSSIKIGKKRYFKKTAVMSWLNSLERNTEISVH